jgi:5-formyltetrahydrofolate cyclo-ligase
VCHYCSVSMIMHGPDIEAPGDEYKPCLRVELLKRRNGIPAERRSALSSRIVQQVLALDEFVRARYVMCYVAVRGEVRTEDLIRRCLERKARVSVPVCDRSSGRISASEIGDFDRDLVPGTYGIPEPRRASARAMDIAEIDVCIVPGVGFDLSGVRLGWGKGCYDMFLAEAHPRAVKIGLAYELQVLPRISRAKNDVLVEMVVTEDRTIDCRKIRESCSTTQ